MGFENVRQQADGLGSTEIATALPAFRWLATRLQG